MSKITRKKALHIIWSAGASNDQQLFIRTYTENRISYTVAIAEFRKGAAFAKSIKDKQ